LIINNLKQRLYRYLDKLLGDDFNLGNITIQEPKNKEFGDLSINASMVLSPVLGKDPLSIANKLIDDLISKWNEIDNIKVIKPGFINFNLNKNFIKESLGKIITEGENYGCNKSSKGINVQLEYVSSNPTGYLHLGHGRWAALGDSLSNIYTANGYNVLREYYVNDYGSQVKNFADCIRCLYLKHFKKKVPYPEEGYPENVVEKVVAEIIEASGDKYIVKKNGEIDVNLQSLGKEGIKIMVSHIRNTLSSMGVKFDKWFYESSLYRDSNFENVIKNLKNKKIIFESDGALWFRSSFFGDDKDRVVVRSDGNPTYFASDILYVLDKIGRGYDLQIYILGADHHGYVKRLEAVGKSAGLSKDGLKVIIGQLVRLIKGGKILKMSKRKGKVFTLRDLISEVGKDPVRYFFCMSSFDTPMDFDVDLAKQKSNKNPVYYVQYAHARIESIIKKVNRSRAAADKIRDFDLSDIDISKLEFQNETESELAKILVLYPDVVYDSCRNNEPYFKKKVDWIWIDSYWYYWLKRY
jgi:arginyl-tRNA synthetase